MKGKVDKVIFNNKIFICSVLENNTISIYDESTSTFIFRSNLAHSKRIKEIFIIDNTNVLIVSEDTIV